MIWRRRQLWIMVTPSAKGVEEFRGVVLWRLYCRSLNRSWFLFLIVRSLLVITYFMYIHSNWLVLCEWDFKILITSTQSFVSCHWWKTVPWQGSKFSGLATFLQPMQLQRVQSPFSMPSRPYCTDSILLDYIRMLHNHFVCIVKICCIVSVCMFCISDCTVSCNEGLQWSGLALREMPGSWLLRRGQWSYWVRSNMAVF